MWGALGPSLLGLGLRMALAIVQFWYVWIKYKKNTTMSIEDFFLGKETVFFLIDVLLFVSLDLMIHKNKSVSFPLKKKILHQKP